VQGVNPRIREVLSVLPPMPENPNACRNRPPRREGGEAFAKGKTADALAEYLQILTDDPENDNVRQMSGGAVSLLNKGPQAVRLLGELFERQVAAADATRASLTYKKLARYANTDVEQKVRFGQLLEHSNKKLAIGTYEKCAGGSAAPGKERRSLAGLAANCESGAFASQPFCGWRNCRRDWASTVTASQFIPAIGGTGGSRGRRRRPVVRAAYTETRRTRRLRSPTGESLLVAGRAGSGNFYFEAAVQAGDASLELRA